LPDEPQNQVQFFRRNRPAPASGVKMVCAQIESFQGESMGLPRFKTVERKYFSFALSETDVFSSASRFLAEGRTRRHERGAECGGR
jgi:hypothetical protein